MFWGNTFGLHIDFLCFLDPLVLGAPRIRLPRQKKRNCDRLMHRAANVILTVIVVIGEKSQKDCRMVRPLWFTGLKRQPP